MCIKYTHTHQIVAFLTTITTTTTTTRDTSYIEYTKCHITLYGPAALYV